MLNLTQSQYIYRKQEINFGTIIVLGVSKTTLRFTDLLGGPTGHVVILMAVTYYNRRIQSKISKGKRHRVKPGGNQVHASETLLPMGSHRTHLVPPAMSSGNRYKVLSTREAHSGHSAQGFYWGLIM